MSRIETVIEPIRPNEVAVWIVGRDVPRFLGSCQADCTNDEAALSAVLAAYPETRNLPVRWQR